MAGCPAGRLAGWLGGRVAGWLAAWLDGSEKQSIDDRHVGKVGKVD